MNERPPAPPWYLKPIWQGLLGLALMVAGWKLATYMPHSASDGWLAAIREMAGEEAELTKRLDRVARSVRGDPPYQLPGRLVLVAGLVLFVAAAVRMYQAVPVPPAEEGANPRNGRSDRSA